MAKTLTGNGAANVLTGGGEKNVLQSGAGADMLAGGLGNDVLVFASHLEKGDSISDFHGVRGANDRFEMHASGFGANLVAGAPTQAQFQSNADGTASRGDNVGFIWPRAAGGHLDLRF